ncbi:MAG: efflux RND transporter periplasmic adaptor subunit [Bacteroidales bacterium]
MKKAVNILLWVIAIGIIVGAAVVMIKKSQKKSDRYEIVKPEKGDINIFSISTGSIVPRKEVEIKPQVSGIVDKLMFEPGAIVKKGDIICRVKVVPDIATLNSAEAQVRQAKIQEKDTKRDYERQQALYEKKVVSLETYQKSEIAFDMAVQQRKAAEEAVEIIRDGVAQSNKGSTNTNIRATISGMILDIPVEEGNNVIMSNNFNDGTTVAIIADMNDMIYEGNIDETEVGKLKSGMKMELSVGALNNETFDAELEYISPKGESVSGAVMFEIKAKVVLKEDQFIRAGYSANGKVIVRTLEDVLSIPEGVVSYEADSSYVEVLKSDEDGLQSFDKRNIKLGESDGINVEVLSGVKEDEQLKGNIILE